MPRTRAVFRFLPPCLSSRRALILRPERARARFPPPISLPPLRSSGRPPRAPRGGRRRAPVDRVPARQGCVVARGAPRAMARGGGGGRADGGEREPRAVVLARKFGINVKLATTIAHWRAGGDAPAAVVARWVHRAHRAGGSRRRARAARRAARRRVAAAAADAAPPAGGRRRGGRRRRRRRLRARRRARHVRRRARPRRRRRAARRARPGLHLEHERLEPRRARRRDVRAAQ